MEVDVLGSGSAFSIARNTSAILVTHHNKRWLIDCGPTIPRALWRRGLHNNDVEVLFFTHIHPDHCAGLPALLNRWKSFGRNTPLTIYCQAEHRATLQQLEALASWPESSLCFEIDWQESQPEWHWQNWRIRTAPTQHEMSNLAIRIDISDQALFYSGDGRPTDQSIELMKHANLAFQECAVSQPLPDDASHGDVENCLQLAGSLPNTTIGLYHCYDEEVTALASKLNSNKAFFLSFDGLRINLSGKQSVIEQVQWQEERA